MANICEKCIHRNVCRYQEPCEECNQFAEEVVRCKNCKWYKEGKYLAPNKFCYRLKDRDGEYIGYNYTDDDFCSYGERKDNERKAD